MLEQTGTIRKNARGLRRKVITTVFALGLLASLALASVGTAFAEPPAPASCMGHEASAISPPGSLGEFPGGMPGLKEFIDQEFGGVPPGAIYATIASLHEGSHELCDEALE